MVRILATLALVVALFGCGAPDGGAESGAERPTPSASPRTSAAPEPRRPKLTESEQQALNKELIAAAWANDVDRARTLIARGADVNAQDGTKQSAFLIAASEGYLDLLTLTLKHGADVDAKDRFNGTALIRAAERGHAEVCAELIRAGVELDHVNNLGWTALHEAVVLGDGDAGAMDTVRVLVEGGVDVTVKSGRFGMTAAEHAEQRGLSDIADLLHSAEATRAGL